MEDLLQQGITAYRAGKRDEARKFFTTLVKQNPDSERAWEWMYNVCSTDNERIHCLKQIIRINPKNEKANQLFAKFTKTDFSAKSMPIIKQSTSQPAQTAKSKSTNETQKTLDPQKQKKLEIGVTAAAFLCVIFIYFSVFNLSSGGVVFTIASLLFFISIIVFITSTIYVYTGLFHERKNFITKNSYSEAPEEFQHTHQMQELPKNFLFILLVSASFCSMYARFLGVGWGLLFAGVMLVGIPFGIHILLHLVAIHTAKKSGFGLFSVIVFSHIFLFLLLSTQWDAFDGPAHNGLIEMLSSIGIDNMPSFYKDKSYNMSGVFAALLLLSWILMFLPTTSRSTKILRGEA